MPSNIDKEKTKKTIALVLENIRTEADPWLLEEYLGLFKKEVSLFNRSKAAAYLLMLCDQGKSLHLAEKKSPRRVGERRPADRNDARRYPLADEESRRLFFSIGRSRRVFPREILGLINAKTGIAKEDIGAIRILDNYSFVQVRDTVAETIIEALHGMSFRGRTLTVNYAKSRRDGESSDNGFESDNQDGFAPDKDMSIDDSLDKDYMDEDLDQGQDHSEEEDI
jgi:hypothetical protein